MIGPIAGRIGRPGATILAAGLVLAGLLSAGQVVGGLLDARAEIAEARARLGHLQAAAGRPPPAAPLSGGDEAALLGAFRARLDALASGRALVIDGARVEADPGSPTLPRLHAQMRGTAEALHGLLAALEAGPPLVVVEAAEIGIARPADAVEERPTALRLDLTARGAVLPAADAPR
ncbi:GspMb/PilO family protein [Methylobacterium oxalidis]|uniref:Uncharacterized protein n=1 Tax=Methylobacterium oxalidis TaxID=944322 RepID=A0A512IZK6_9HYPH|nr:GspMb/PilO family protein [Methylobacterium oxalidis]GEP03105.1 hypothetical protein MOX02_11430 [Methylobacterium oxalidis]GJE31734.1 hypothetical protein LDDCCGHA_1914 [Methylobacterium oxalidis]GLS67364.1 hypothetical protein GCM10007888_57480 [Methylobacterium oxalidis]